MTDLVASDLVVKRGAATLLDNLSLSLSSPGAIALIGPLLARIRPRDPLNVPELSRGTARPGGARNGKARQGKNASSGGFYEASG